MREHLDEAVATLEPLVKEGQWEFAEYLGEANFEKGMALEAVGRRLDALSAYAVAREQLADIVLRGGRPDLANKLAAALRNEANLNWEPGRAAEAARLSDQAVDLFRRLGQGKERRQYLSLLGRALAVQSGCLLMAADLKALTGLRPEDSPQWSARAEEAIESGRNLSRAGDAYHACELFDEAILIYGVLVKTAARAETRIRALAEAHMTKAIVAMYCGTRLCR